MRYYLPPRQGPTYVLDKSALYLGVACGRAG